MQDDNNLRGYLPSEIQNFQSLKYLSLDRNFIEGTLPQGLETLVRLDSINLQDTNITGSVDFLCQGTDVDLKVDLDEVDCGCSS